MVQQGQLAFKQERPNALMELEFAALHELGKLVVQSEQFLLLQTPSAAKEFHP